MSKIDFDEMRDNRYNHHLLTGGPAQGGLTVLDEFAKAALQGMLAENGGGALDNRELAVVAYAVAADMLKERTKRNAAQAITAQGVTGRSYG